MQSIRNSVSGVLSEIPNGNESFPKVDPEQHMAWWGNGWHNGGWGNGLLPFIFGNPWGNGWHNG